MPNASERRVDLIFPFLIKGMNDYEINTPLRENHFIAQVAHESGEFKYMEELASGDSYDARTDLGNTPQVDGDGRKYKGRGLIQLTGANNYYKCGKALGVNLMENPKLLSTPEYASRSACWFWWAFGLNPLADLDKFVSITKRINGGTNGITDRKKYLDRAMEYNPLC